MLPLGRIERRKNATGIAFNQRTAFHHGEHKGTEGAFLCDSVLSLVKVLGATQTALSDPTPTLRQGKAGNTLQL